MAQIIIDSSNNLIQGDFDNATVNNRTKFKTTTLNGTTNVYAVPNGSSTSAGYSVSNAADPTNASKITIATNGSTDTQIISGINGTGSYLPLSFYTNNALAGQFTTAGLLSLPGGGITFPATQVPSANANTLDDYEEGTWTPTITFNSTNGNLAYSVQDGAYTKIGNLVWVGGTIVFSQTTGSSYFWINNLPFTSKNISANCITSTGISVTGMTSIVGGVSAAVYPNSVTAYPYTGQTGTVGVILSAYCNGGTATLYFGFTYITS